MVAVLSHIVAKRFKEKTGIDVIGLPSFECLDTPVDSHADMLLSVIDNNIFVYKEYYESNKELFHSLSEKYKIINVEKPCQRHYPEDIALNVLVIGKKIFCKIKSVAAEILNYAQENGYKLINISQGYSACSTLVINENVAITGDKGVYNALVNEGIKALLISNDDIRLDGYNSGFIGGACGVYDKKVFVFGEIEKLSSHQSFLDFIKAENCTLFEVLTGDVCDFGGIKLLN